MLKKGISYFLLFLIIGFVLTIYGAIEYKQTKTPTGEFVTLNAVCKKVVEVDDDGDTDYKVYLTYEYDGYVYEDIYYEEVDNKKDIPKNVTIEIDTAYPSIIHDNSVGFSIFLIVIGSLFLISFPFVASVSFSESKSQNFYGDFYFKNRYIDAEIIKKELNFELKHQIKYELYFGIFFTVLLSIVSGVCYFKYELPYLIYIYLPLAAVFWAFYFVNYLGGKRTNNNIYIIKDEILGIYEDWKYVEGGYDKKYWSLTIDSKVDIDSVNIVSHENVNKYDIPKGTQFYIALDRHRCKRRFFFVKEFNLKES